jgi:hypothetical protein
MALAGQEVAVPSKRQQYKYQTAPRHMTRTWQRKYHGGELYAIVTMTGY